MHDPCEWITPPQYHCLSPIHKLFKVDKGWVIGISVSVIPDVNSRITWNFLLKLNNISLHVRIPLLFMPSAVQLRSHSIIQLIGILYRRFNLEIPAHSRTPCHFHHHRHPRVCLGDTDSCIQLHPFVWVHLSGWLEYVNLALTQIHITKLTIFQLQGTTGGKFSESVLRKLYSSS